MGVAQIGWTTYICVFVLLHSFVFYFCIYFISLQSYFLTLIPSKFWWILHMSMCHYQLHGDRCIYSWWWPISKIHRGWKLGFLWSILKVIRWEYEGCIEQKVVNITLFWDGHVWKTSNMDMIARDYAKSSTTLYL